MSAIAKSFGTILGAVILILIGLDIIAVVYYAAPLHLLTSLNVAVLGLVVLYRGLREVDRSERRFYVVWALVFFNIALSITVSSALENALAGLSAFLVGLGAILIYSTVKL